MSYEESVAYMSGLLQFGIRLGRDRFVALLARLGDPHKKLRCVHVAGTNGKGSTTTFIASVLQAAGYNVGAYLSPFVFDLRERIQVGGRMIPEADFARWVTMIRPHIEAIARDPELGQTTEFELKTAVALCYFAEQSVDFAVVEVGIGGRLDATNVIPPPLVAVITHIGLDHTHILGDTLARIASEKAGILKPGTLACVTGVSEPEALAVIAETAQRCDVPLLRVGPGRDEFVQYGDCHDQDAPPDAALRLVLPDGPLFPVRLRLPGPFQRANAAAAAAAIEVLRANGIAAISREAMRAGLERALLPGRFQIVRGSSARDAALVLDVAHNEAGARALAAALRSTFPGRRDYVLVVGMSRSHEPEPFLRALAPLGPRVWATAPSFKPLPAAEVADAARRLGLPTRVVEPASAAILEALDGAGGGDGVVVVTGSFYTVGETPPPLRGAFRAGSEIAPPGA